MRDRLIALFVRFALPLTLVLSASPVLAQVPGPPGPPDGVAALLNRLELLLQKDDRDNFPSLLSTSDITGQEAEQKGSDRKTESILRA